MSLRNIEVQYIGDKLYLPSLERKVNHIIVYNIDVNGKEWEFFEKENKCKNCAALNRAAGLWAKADKRARELERTCHMFPSDYYPCAEDGCMRLSMRMWTCSECEADCTGSKPNYCPNCGRKVMYEC